MRIYNIIIIIECSEVYSVYNPIAIKISGSTISKCVRKEPKIHGVNNIIIQPVIESQEVDAEESINSTNKFSPGLKMKDLLAIRKIIPVINKSIRI